MLEIIYSPDWKALSHSATRRIADEAGQGKSGQVLLVPEQYSFESERDLCEAGGDQISRFAEVLSFSRLAERSCVRCGGVADSVMDQGGRIMALAQVVSHVRTELRFYARSASRADFLEQMLSIVDELKCYRVAPAQLTAAAERLEGTLAVKICELALLLEGYETVCANARPDPRDRLEQLLSHILERGFGKDLRLYVDGFFGFTALELEILGAFLSCGTDVTVYLCCDGLFQGAQLFSGVRQTARDLMREADRYGVRVSQSALDTPATALNEIALSAFSQCAAENSAGLRLYQSPGPREEVSAVCADILAHVRAGGRYRDIAVACAAPEQLRPVFEAEFERCGIPAFFAGKKPALRTPLLSAVLSALRAATGRMELDDVIAYLRSDGAPISGEECDLIENYALLWSVSGDQWGTEWPRHRRGLDEKMEETDLQKLSRLNDLRRRFVGPVMRLRDELRKCATVGQCVVAFYDFLCETDFSRCVSALLAAQEAGEEPQQAIFTGQLYELLINALEQLYGVQYDVQTKPEEFLRLMEILLSQYQVGAIPAVLDAVTVGSPADLQHRHSPLVFLCGCADGSFPQSVGGGSLLNETERRRLRAAGIALAPDENEQMDRNLVGAYALLSAADERLTISSSGQSAWLFTTLCQLYPDRVRTDSEAPPTAFATEKTLGLYLAGTGQTAQASPAASAYCERLRQAGAYTFGALTGDTIRGLYGRDVFLSASRIDRLAACRFQFFLNDGLKARERKAASFDAPIYGTFVHDVLEHTVRRVMSEGGFRQVDKARVRQIAVEQMDLSLRSIADAQMLASGRFAYLMGRNYDEVLRVVDVLTEELAISEFEPVDFELKFGDNGPLPPVRIQAKKGTATVSGAVDRVDLANINGKTYFRVVDYKTGRKDFDYTDLLERRGLQMLIYMFALEQFGASRYGAAPGPAGVLYVPAHDDMIRFSQKPADDDAARKERLKSHRRQGLLLNDETLLQAMEPCGDASPALLPYKRGRDGARGDLMDGGQLRVLRRYIDEALQSVTDEICGGSVQPNPYTRGSFGACSWCPYASVCHLDLCENEPRSLRATGAEEFWARLDRREARHG